MKIDKLNDAELKIWVSLARTVGPTKFLSLLKTDESLCDIAGYLNELNGQDAEQEIENTEKIGAKIIPVCDPIYPDFLRKIPDCPPLIIVLGNISLLDREIIAIVGGRNSSINGRNFANKLAIDISKSGIVIVSGLARGIDTAANSIIYKNYPTIAVMASGIDVVYPKENLTLYNKIIDGGGLIITELPFSTQPKPQYFPQRNRIISGLSVGVVVIEASIRSGSLITANFALNQGREVFAVPGFPMDPRSSGSNHLIKNGARLIESADDVIESLRFNLSTTQEKLFAHLPHTQQEKAKDIIIEHINSVPTNIDDLILASGLPADIILIAISELELENKIERLSGNKISLILNPSLKETP